MTASRKYAAFTTAALMLLSANPADASPRGFQVGGRFPDLVLPALDDGRPLSIASFRGRKLVLHVWASW